MTNDESPPLMLKVIACEVATREICAVVAASRNTICLEFLSQAHHERPMNGAAEIQQRIDATSPNHFDAILLGYGLCNRLLDGVTARDTKLVVPRAHDCLTFLIGSRERYLDHFMKRPGSYYYSTGWLEGPRRVGRDIQQNEVGELLGEDLDSLIERYGEENARYLMELGMQWRQKYARGSFIRHDFLDHLKMDRRVQETCRQNGWAYEEIPATLNMLRSWIDGEWDSDDFIIIEPGMTIRPTYDERVIEATDELSDPQPQVIES
ncbi:MAG: DUF1638 domain-containing protein [Armatimonadetes bacterium]|nr:DUF1638 domain-containing protein [Armatimonadota bacterium]